MKFKKIDSKPNLQQIQNNVINFWKEQNLFEKSVNKKNKGEIVFYDGPPFPTGKPHHGTVLISFIKDMIARYHTMQGYSVPRQWGWDCHGLPIENQVEKNLNISLKSEIENTLGIDKFNDACYNVVSANNDNWRDYVEQMARWVDYDNSYKTLDTNFMESVIWAFKTCYDKGLIYKDYRVTPYCYRCETSLSISDTRESDSTRPKQDNWAMAKFDAGFEIEHKPVYFLAWTTTPWTLPSNMALAVGPEIDYVYAEVNEEVFVACEQALPRYEKIFGKQPKVLKTFKGTELVGKTYKPLLPYFAHLASEGAFKVIAADFVDSGDGIGVVHIAPAFGEDDYWACKKAGVPLVNPVDEKGNFDSSVTDFAGRNVMEANRDILRFLKTNNLIVDDGTLEHNYPHCWRCRTPLIYKAMDAWYFNVDKIKSKLLQINEGINWIPDSVKHGRFGNWLENARDWNISRNRYWSTPLPVWFCEKCNKYEVLGSIQEIYEKSGIKLTDLHRQHMDKVTFDCACGGTFKRIPEVLDCWFESGAVPFARMHYPFENKEWFEKNITSDYVSEGAGQIRCWFYYLLVLSGALFDKAPFKNVMVHGTVLAKDGKKLSKSSKNYTDPMELMKSYGTDAFRLYMFGSNAMLLGDMQFDEGGVLEALQSVILPLWNSCSFFLSYAEIDGVDLSVADAPNPVNELDKWLLAKLYNAQKHILTNMDKYQIDEYITPINDLIDGLTNWYIRNSRRRFWGKESEDKLSAYKTLYYVLVNTIKLMAPLTPIIAEELYQKLTGNLSVHLQEFTEIPECFKNEQLLHEVELVQNIISLARSLRAKNNIKNRQPLSLLEVALNNKVDIDVVKKYNQVICEELNVKQIEIVEDVNQIATVMYKPNFAVIKQSHADKMPQIIGAVRAGKFELNANVVVFDLGSEKAELSLDALLVEYQAKQGLNVVGENGIVVAMDLTLTPELVAEGFAREVVRNIQDTRKTMGLNIMDNIELKLEGNYPEQWTNYVLTETLGHIASEGEFNTVIDVETSDYSVKIYIRKKCD